MLTLGTTAGGIALAMRGKGTAKEKAPPINASSKEEEAFIQLVYSLLGDPSWHRRLLTLLSETF